jgi:hypothetical protein
MSISLGVVQAPTRIAAAKADQVPALFVDLMAEPGGQPEPNWRK